MPSLSNLNKNRLHHRSSDEDGDSYEDRGENGFYSRGEKDQERFPGNLCTGGMRTWSEGSRNGWQYELDEK